MPMSQDARNTIRDASRAQIEKILESNGYQVYDHETTDFLRENLLNDVESGVISEADLDLPVERLMDPRDR